MCIGARTPEELDALFEDACVLRDHGALAQLFAAGAVLVAGGGLREARGVEEIERITAEMWDLGRAYVADPCRVFQVRDTALVLTGRAIHMARRDDDGSWRYTVSLLDYEENLGVRPSHA